MIPEAWRAGEVAVIGLARTGRAATRWLRREGLRVYASDAARGLSGVADDLSALGADVATGGHDLSRIRAAAAVIVSPGVPPDAPVLEAARAAGVPVHAEIDLAARALPETRLVAVTGTNGKSTTTALIAHLLSSAGVACPAVGNIGRPLIELALDAAAPPWAAVEVSSFQLHDAPTFAPAIGVLTNLSPDHLDRYDSVEAYYADKRLLFRNATPASVWIVNGDDPSAQALGADAVGTHRSWRVTGEADAWYDRAAGTLMIDHSVIPRDAIPLLGDHNVENVLAAGLAALATGLPPDALGAGVRSFTGLPHRLEVVRDVDGICWINDSKATNVGAAAVGLAAMDRPYVAVMGGRHKGDPFTPLVPVLAGRCRAIVAYGEAARLVEGDLGQAVPVTVIPLFADAVGAAAERARSGDAVILAPACSSFDQFPNYEVRGETFRELVEAL